MKTPLSVQTMRGNRPFWAVSHKFYSSNEPQAVDPTLNLRCLQVPFGACGARILHLLSNREAERDRRNARRQSENKKEKSVLCVVF